MPTILKLCIPLFLGVLFQYYFRIEFNVFYSVLIVFLVLILTNIPAISRVKSLQFLPFIFIQILFFLLGMLNVNHHSSILAENYFFQKGDNIYQIRLNAPPVEKEKSIKLVVDVLQRNDVNVIGKSLVYVEKSKVAESLKYGDVLLAKVNFNSIKTNGNPEEFDYKSFLEKSDIHHQGYLKSNDFVKIGNKSNWLFNFTYGLRAYFSRIIDKSDFKKENKPILKALLLGNKDELDKETLRTYSSAGAMHVLAVSGLHVGIVMVILMFVLKPLKKLKLGGSIYVGLILLGVWFFAFLTGLSPSVMRSALMFSFITIGTSLERETTVYQSILVSALVLMIIDPFVIFKVGFQLSYLAVLGIVYLQPKIYNLIYIKYKIVDYFWQITAVSIAAQIATFPLGLYYFHQFPNFFMISNLLVIPLAGFILTVGLFYFVFHAVDFLNTLAVYVLDLLLTLMNKSVHWVESMPYSIMWGISITWKETLLIYAIILLVVFGFVNKKIRLVFYGAYGVIVLLTIFIYNDLQLNAKKEIVIYNVKDNIALDIFYGRKNIFIADQSLKEDKNKLLFHVQHNWFYRLGNETENKYISTEKIENSIIKCGNVTLSIYQQDRLYKTDVVLIGEIDYVGLDDLKKLASNNSKIILTGAANYKTKRFIKSNYKKRLIYDLKEHGALTVSF